MKILKDEASIEEVDKFIDELIEETEYHHKALKTNKSEVFQDIHSFCDEKSVFLLIGNSRDCLLSIEIYRSSGVNKKDTKYMCIESPESIEIEEHLFFTDNEEVVDFVYDKLKGYWE